MKKDRCFCGEIIIADSENFNQPLCHSHFCEFLKDIESDRDSKEETIKEMADYISTQHRLFGGNRAKKIIVKYSQYFEEEK